MTYKRLKKMVTGFTFGDTSVPTDPEVMLALLEAAFLEITNHATALKLLTATADLHIIRKGPGGRWVRMPELPSDDTDEMDIDYELCPAVARLLASYISKKKPRVHFEEAKRIIYDYDSKVDHYIKSQELDGVYDDVR